MRRAQARQLRTRKTTGAPAPCLRAGQTAADQWHSVAGATRARRQAAIFGAVIVAVSDPGRNYGYRVPRLAVVAAVGALLTALGFGIGGGAWGFVVLAAFAATLLGGLAVTYGLHRFVAAYLLNIWFIIALGLPTLISFQVPGLFGSGLIHTEPWQQALA